MKNNKFINIYSYLLIDIKILLFTNYFIVYFFLYGLYNEY